MTPHLNRRVARWLSELTDIDAPLEFDIITGGRSNLTYLVTDAAGRKFALRRPPKGRAIESAHDVIREARILQALKDAAVPVPEVIGYRPADHAIDFPYFVMEFIEGAVIRTEVEAHSLLGVSARMRSGTSIAETLADLHGLEPEVIGLGDFARADSYVERQLKRWHGQSQILRTRPLPALDTVHDRLAWAVPEQLDVSVVHGDYRLDNLILSPSTGKVRAVLDWELATLGDPRADLGMLLVYWSEKGDATTPFSEAPTAVEGFPTRDAMIRHYLSRRGQSVPELEYFIAFGYWRLACILEGVYSRYLSGTYGKEYDALFADIEESVPALLEDALVRVEHLG